MDDKRTSPGDLDRYIGKELESFYGADYVKQARMNAPPPRPPKRRRGLPLSITLCAAVFLTGALMLAGVFFTDIPAHPTAGRIDTTSSAVNSAIDNSALADNSSIAESSAVIKSSSVTENSSVVKNSAVAESSSVDENSSVVEKSTSENTSSKEEESHSRHEYSLPELPSDGSAFVPQSDPNNNSITNPYDNVTTGRRARAGIGIFLMISSLCCAAALANFYKDEEKET